MTRNQYRRKRMEQRLTGLGLLACAVLVSVLDGNWTSTVMLSPMALRLAFTHKIIL